MEKKDLVKKIPLFSSLTDDDIDKTVECLKEEVFDKGEYIFMEGDPSEWLCIVKSGEVRIMKHSASGKDVILDLFSPGEIFGGVAVFDKKPYPASAQAMEPQTIVLKIPRKWLFTLIDKYPAMVSEAVIYLGRKLRDAHTMMKNLAVERVERRIAAILLKLTEKAGEKDEKGIRLNMHLTRQDIAEMAGTTVETAIRVMSRFKKEGVVKSYEGKIVILDLKRLSEISGR
ncbi:MAG: Crp/Fnr family transcriptional regulator [Nitrospirae bacterium]|nr:Crp/Fnr family transcriptional regulator [Nitrospirota bacterium]